MIDKSINNSKFNWKTINEIKAPYNDAVNYKSRAEKEFFQKIFLRTEDLKNVTSNSIYYIIGEKGSGKTAYAVYYDNNSPSGIKSQLTTMTETQYLRFINLKRQGKLVISDYANIWRSMLLFMVGRMVVEKSKNPLHYVTGKFSKIEGAIKKWSSNALNPEIESAFEAITSETVKGNLKAGDFGEVQADSGFQQTTKDTVLRHHLLETESIFKEAISSLKLSDSHILFIDGIDFRPENVNYGEYINCIKGLGEAAWQLNTEYFNNIRDSKGRIKIVLLIRPDVFHVLNLYNSNSRLQDNCIFLDWSTTEKEYKTSPLYSLSERFFSVQQEKQVTEDCWNKYYEQDGSLGYSFKKLIKTSFQKPRDILTFIRLSKSHANKQGKGNLTKFDDYIVDDVALGREYSDYLLGEVRNYAAFYMTQDDFSKYLKIFQYLNGSSKFVMSDFRDAFDLFKKWAQGEKFNATEYLRDAESLLQLLYDVNLVGYSEELAGANENFFHWSYRERSANNIAPQVKTSGKLMLNPGVSKALDIGRKFSKNKDKPEGQRARHSDHRVNRGSRGRRGRRGSSDNKGNI